MATKVTPNETKGLNLRNVSLVTHWKLEKWAKNKKLGKYEAAEKILHDAVKSVKLDLQSAD